MTNYPKRNPEPRVARTQIKLKQKETTRPTQRTQKTSPEFRKPMELTSKGFGATQYQKLPKERVEKKTEKLTKIPQPKLVQKRANPNAKKEEGRTSNRRNPGNSRQMRQK